MRTRIWTAVLAALFVLTVPSPARAAHHLWRIHQLFSNAAGTVQFIELETTTAGATGETSLSTFSLTTGVNTVSFSNLTPGSTGATQWLLIATSNEATLPGGVMPDFTPVSSGQLFAPQGGTITYAGGADTWTYGAVPTDGIHALTRDPNTEAVTTTVNAPENLVETVGQLNLSVLTPALPAWGIALGIGALLLAGSGLLGQRRRRLAS